MVSALNIGQQSVKHKILLLEDQIRKIIQRNHSMTTVLRVWVTKDLNVKYDVNWQPYKVQLGYNTYNWDL